MIDAAIVTNPMDFGASLAGSAGTKKAPSDSPSFDSVLSSKVSGSQEKPVEAREQSVNDHAGDGAEAAPEREQPGQQNVQTTTAQQGVVETALSSAVQNQLTQLVEAVSETSAVTVETDTSVASALETGVKPAPADVSLEDVLASAVTSEPADEQPEEISMELPGSAREVRAMAEENALSGKSADTEVRGRFFGTTNREDAQALVDAQMKAKTANSASTLFYSEKTTIERTPDAKSGDHPMFAQAAKNAGHVLASEALLTSAFKPVEGVGKDVTYTQQLIAAITQNTEQKSDMAQTFTGQGGSNGESAKPSVQQLNTQDAALVVPGRASFETVIRGLESAAPAGAPESPDTDVHTRVIDQIVREVRLRQYQGGSDILVKLNPAELGQIRLQISHTADGMTSQIHASSEQVKGLLQAHLPALTEALSSAGLKMDQVTVTSGASFGSLMQENAFGQTYQQRNSHRHSHSGGQDTAFDPAMISAVNNVAVSGSAGYSWLA